MNEKISADTPGVKGLPGPEPTTWSLRRRLAMTGPTNPQFRDGRWTRHRRRLEADVKDLLSKARSFDAQLAELPDPWARARGAVLLERLRAVPPPDGPAGWAMTTRRGALYIARKAILVARRWRALALAVLRLIRAALARTCRAIESASESRPTAGASSSPKAVGLQSEEVQNLITATTTSSRANRPREEPPPADANVVDDNEAMNRKRFLHASTVQSVEELLRLFNDAVPASMREVSISWLDGIRARRRLREQPERAFWVRAFAEISRSRRLLGLDRHEPELLATFSRMVRRTYLPGYSSSDADDNGVGAVAAAAEDGHWRSEPAELARLARNIPELRRLWASTAHAVAEADQAEQFAMWGWAT